MTSTHLDWRLTRGVASIANLSFLIVVLLSFPLVLRLTGALSFGEIDPQSPQHCGSPKCHRPPGALRISNIQFEAERREFKQDKA